MPKVTRFGGHSIAGITDTATGQTERDGGFSDDTAATEAAAAERAAGGLLAGGDGTGNEDNGEPVAAPFDPGELSVADVQNLLTECSDAEREAVIAAERAGKNRKGITGE